MGIRYTPWVWLLNIDYLPAVLYFGPDERDVRFATTGVLTIEGQKHLYLDTSTISRSYGAGGVDRIFASTGQREKIENVAILINCRQKEAMG